MSERISAVDAGAFVVDERQYRGITMMPLNTSVLASVDNPNGLDSEKLEQVGETCDGRPIYQINSAEGEINHDVALVKAGAESLYEINVRDANGSVRPYEIGFRHDPEEALIQMAEDDPDFLILKGAVGTVGYSLRGIEGSSPVNISAEPKACGPLVASTDSSAFKPFG